MSNETTPATYRHRGYDIGTVSDKFLTRRKEWMSGLVADLSAEVEALDAEIVKRSPIRASFLPIVIATYDRTTLEIIDLEFEWSDSYNEDDDEVPEEFSDDDTPLTKPMDDLIRTGVFNDLVAKAAAIVNGAPS